MLRAERQAWACLPSNFILEKPEPGTITFLITGFDVDVVTRRKGEHIPALELLFFLFEKPDQQSHMVGLCSFW